MKCVSCDTEIDPKWKAAIDKNLCPFCGNEILDANLQELFSSLRDTMDELQENYKEHVDDFLFSNYSYVHKNKVKIEKVTDEQTSPTKKKKILTPDGIQEVDYKKSTISEIYERAGLLKADEEDGVQFSSMKEKTEFIKAKAMGGKPKKLSTEQAAELIKSGSYDRPTPNASALGLPQSMLDQATPAAIEEYQQMMASGPAEQYQAPSNDEERLPAAVERMLRQSANSNNTPAKADKDLNAMEEMVVKSRGIKGTGMFRR